MIDVATAPESPGDVPARGNRAWRIVAIVVAFQVLIIVIGVVLFSALGLATDGVGGCGGG